MEQFKDSDFYRLLDMWGLLKDKTAISNMMKKAITYFFESKSTKFETLRDFLTAVMNSTKGSYRKIQKVPVPVFIKALTPIENIPEILIKDIFDCSLEANLELIGSHFFEDPIFETIDGNGLKSLDFYEVVSKYKFETEGAANEFYLVFANYLYLMATTKNISVLSEEATTNNVSAPSEDKWQDAFSEFWIFVLFQLSQLDIDAPDWDQFPYVVKNVEILRASKKQKRKEEVQQKIDNSLNELKREKNRNIIDLFDMKNLLLWSGSSISPSIDPNFNDILQRLIEKFDKYKKIDGQHNETKDLKKRKKARRNLDKIENALTELYEQACRVFDEAPAAEAEEQKTEAINTKDSEMLNSADPGLENEKLRNMGEKMDKIQVQNNELKNQVAEKDKILATKEHEKTEIDKKFEEASSELANRHLKIDAISNLQELPKNLSEAVKLIEAIFPEKLSFSDEAKKSAKTASTIPIDIAWPCLFHMATTLHDLFFVESKKRIEIEKKVIDVEKQFKDRTGLILAMTEGKRTNRDPNFLKLRTITYEGKEISIVPHVKSGTKSPKLLRVYFFIDNENRKLVVGHCGDHLDNYSTRSLK